MTAVKISLNSIDKVKSFCNDIAKLTQNSTSYQDVT